MHLLMLTIGKGVSGGVQPAGALPQTASMQCQLQKLRPGRKLGVPCQATVSSPLPSPPWRGVLPLQLCYGALREGGVWPCWARSGRVEGRPFPSPLQIIRLSRCREGRGRPRSVFALSLGTGRARAPGDNNRPSQ